MTGLKLVTIGILLSLTTGLQAQVSLNVTIGTPPQWGPAGYSDVRYYYLPDVEAYYDVHSSQFICYSGGKWIYRPNLPRQYRNYDLYNGYKVVMTDYHGDTPYTHFNDYKIKYAKGYKEHGQKTIGVKPGHNNKLIKAENESNNKSAGQESSKNRKKGKQQQWKKMKIE